MNVADRFAQACNGSDGTATRRRVDRGAARRRSTTASMHDLRDRLSLSERDAPVPGTQVRRAAVRALPRARTTLRSTQSVDYCSGCGICTQVCPQGVKIAEINAQARQQAQSAERGVPLRDRIITRPTRCSGGSGRRSRHWPMPRCGRGRCGSLAEKTLGSAHVTRAVPAFAGRRFSRSMRDH